MDARMEKARELVVRGRVIKQDGHRLVFSLTSVEKYKVTLHPVSCTCADYELRQEPCKHVIAVRVDILRKSSDARLGKPIREIVGGEPIQRPRKTYKQDWPAYGAAQTNEKAEFLQLLTDLCAGIE